MLWKQWQEKIKQMIKYKLREFELTFDVDGDPRRMWKGYVDGMNLSKNVRQACEFDKEDIEQMFSIDDILLLEKGIHPEYVMYQEDKELDKAFKFIKAMKKKDFVENVRMTFNVEGLDGELTTTKLSQGNKKSSLTKTGTFANQRIYEWDDLRLEYSDTKTANNIFIDMIRRKYNYDDPYKHVDFKEHFNKATKEVEVEDDKGFF